MSPLDCVVIRYLADRIRRDAMCSNIGDLKKIIIINQVIQRLERSFIFKSRALMTHSRTEKKFLKGNDMVRYASLRFPEAVRVCEGRGAQKTST